MTNTFRDILNERIKGIELSERQSEAKNIQGNMPYYFRQKRWKPEDSKAFIPLKEKATGKEWHDTIMLIQLALKDNTTDNRELMQAVRELTEWAMGSYSTLVETYRALMDAYDMQGKVVLRICEKIGVDFEELIADFALAHDEKGLAYVLSDTSTVSTEEKTEGPEEVPEDSESSLPF